MIRRRLLAILPLAGCFPPATGDPLPEVVLEVPEIASFDLRCNADRGKWALAVEATSWTGGGTTHWTVDGDYVEAHAVRSVAAEPDGSWDSLALNLDVTADWRNVKNGGPTAFSCGDDPTVVFGLNDLDGNRVDCRVTGPRPKIWQNVRGVSGCQQEWFPPL